jgi:hypothetical protein
MQAPQNIKKNFIALLSEATEEPGAHASRQIFRAPVMNRVVSLIASIWRRAHSAT